MFWPTPQDYNEALQHPQSSFADPELKKGTPALTPLGLPRPITGGFASVYRIRCGRRDWAVRCFLREFADQSHRYAAISKHLAGANLSYMVGFDFQQQGIKVNGNWFPILKMEWVQGDLLGEYIQRNLTRPGSIAKLAGRWLKMMNALRDRGISHGDLQPGNVVVVNGDFRLIDYDGMFVPAMNGQSSHEVGHRHFQHPLRKQSDFGPTLDHFSAWVIYTSLVALGIDPSLWQQTHAGDDALLFQEKDFKSPASSTTFQLLLNHSDKTIQKLAEQCRSLLSLRPMNLPSVESQGHARRALAIKPLLQSANSRLHRLSRRAGKIIATFIPSEAYMTNLVQSSSDTDRKPASWMDDYATKKTNSSDNAGSANGRSELLKQLRETTRQVSALEREIEQVEHRKTSLQNRHDASFEIQRKRSAQLCAEKSRLQTFINGLRDQRLAVLKIEKDALRLRNTRQKNRVSQSAGARLSELNRQIKSINLAKADEVGSKLAILQQEFLNDCLAGYKIDKAVINDQSDRITQRLIRYGITTAAEIPDSGDLQIPGITPAKWRALEKWRRQIEAESRKSMPSVLPENELRRIEAAFQSRIENLKRQIAATQLKLEKELGLVRKKHAEARRILARRESKVKKHTEQVWKENVAHYLREEKLMADSHQKLTDRFTTEKKTIDGQLKELRQQAATERTQIALGLEKLRTFQPVSFYGQIMSFFGVASDD